MVVYCCPTVYDNVLKARLVHQNLYHSLLNLLIRQNIFRLCKYASFVYQNKFEGHIAFFGIKISFCWQRFYTLPHLPRSIGKCYCERFVGQFDCEICKIGINFFAANLYTYQATISFL